MDSEAFHQEYNKLMLETLKTVGPGSMPMIVLNLRKPQMLARYLDSMVDHQARKSMTQLSKLFESARIAEFDREARTMAGNFNDLLRVRKKWSEIFDRCGGPDGFKEAYIAHLEAV